MVKSTSLQYSPQNIDFTWAHHPGHALRMVLKMSTTLAVETLERDAENSVLPQAPNGDADQAKHARAIALWAAEVVAQAVPKDSAAAERLADAAQHLEVIADTEALIASSPLKLRQTVANAVLHGARLGGFKWRNPPHRPKGSSPFPTEDLEEIIRRMEAGETGAAAASVVLGKLQAGEKNRNDSAVKAARRLKAVRAGSTST